MEHGDIVVQDLDSKNGVHVAGQRVERRVIRPGDEVLLGALNKMKSLGIAKLVQKVGESKSGDSK